MRLRFEPLGVQDRAAFCCGEDSVDRFLKQSANQRQAKQIGYTVVAVDADGDPQRIIGFYTLLPHEFRGTELPDPYRRGTKVGSLSAIPGALLAQLGIAEDFKGQGISKTLVKHALVKTLAIANDWGCAAIVVDPLNAIARNLYSGFDFTPLEVGAERMILATVSIEAVLKKV